MSSRTPNATVMPICVRATSGSTASTENVPARTTPAEVITPPVTARPRRIASRVGRSERLLAHACHQEDVVVDPERDEEDEREERVARVLAREVGEEVEEDEAAAQGRREREDDRRDEHHRRGDGAQEEDEDHEDDREDERDEDLRVVLHGGSQVGLLRGRPADQHGVPGRSPELVAERDDRGEAALAERLPGQDHVEARSRVSALRRADAGDAVALARAATAGPTFAGSVTRTTVGALSPGGKCLGDQPLTLRRLDRSPEGVRGRQIVVEAEGAEREDAEGERRADPRGPPALFDAPAEPTPEARARSGAPG